MDVSLGQFFAICLGGGLGSLLRAGLAQWMGRHLSPSSAIVAVNLSGSFLIGAAFASAAAGSGPHLSQDAFVLLGIGFLGGYTTVSTYALQVWELWQQGEPRRATLIATGSAIACPLAAVAGVFALGAGF